MIALYPGRLNPSPVWYGALGLLGGWPGGRGSVPHQATSALLASSAHSSAGSTAHLVRYVPGRVPWPVFSRPILAPGSVTPEAGATPTPPSPRWWVRPTS